ncbi:hypothetical protein GN244_ATG17563 [Phytophthora infestans]|uniref:Uncharacterized protein n=1 Tax=Phytophthora infestans TaxID=4787 RepID=A0A833SN31_PHYIN|nr:hypothetical protein GN244_ATG17563 [Phytophthora infestans]
MATSPRVCNDVQPFLELRGIFWNSHRVTIADKELALLVILDLFGYERGVPGYRHLAASCESSFHSTTGS